MAPIDSYKGPDNTEQLGDIQYISPSIEFKKIQVETDGNSVKDELSSLKQEITNIDSQLNNKVEEVIDTLEEQLGKELSEEEKNELNFLLLDSAKNSSGSKSFVDNVSLYVKEYGNEITIEYFKNIIGMVIEEEIVDEGKEEINEEKEEINEEKEEINEEKEEINEGKEEMNKEKENLKNLNNSLSGLNTNNEYYGNIVKLINELISGDFDKIKYNEIINLLKNDENAFVHMAEDLEKQNPEKYEQFKSSLITIDQSFRERFDNYESGIVASKQLTVLGVTDTKGIDIGKSPLIKKTEDGFEIEAGKDGRKLSISGSKYKMDAKLNNNGDIREIMNIEKDMKEEVKGLNDSLDSISDLLKYIGEAISNNTGLEEAKQNILSSNPDLYYELHIATASSLELIKQGISGEYTKKEQEKKKILKEKKSQIENMVKNNTREAKKLDARKKETLTFLDSIGFDEIPQSDTDNIIRAINHGNKKSVLGFKNDIDLVNGNLGTNLDGDINSFGEKEKKFFAEFMNILMTGSKDKPISIESMNLGIPVFRNESGEIVRNRDAYIKKTMGLNPLSTMQINIVQFINN